MTIWYILCSFGTFFLFWCHVPRKIWQPCFQIKDSKSGKQEIKVISAFDDAFHVFLKRHDENDDGTSKDLSMDQTLFSFLQPGLPDFSLYMIPKAEKCTKWS
jgi:hypothetical protein